jgi:YegS/Rv2252/BmrU family lipid kinase
MDARATVIVNPAAGANRTHRMWPVIKRLIEGTGLSFDSRLTEGKGHAIELARRAVKDGCRYLVAVGGDGTVHEVANGLLEAPVPEETVLGIVCTGTGSDLSRSVGTPRDYKRACSVLTSTARRTLDTGLLEYHKEGRSFRRYFLNAAGIGFDAAVVEATERMPKYFGGTIPYLTGLARSLLSYRNKVVDFRIDGRAPERAKILSMVMANGGYFGGGMFVAPEARLDDGLFDVVIVGDFGKLELVKVFPRVYKGTHLGYPKVRLERGSRVSIESSQRFLVHADGELLGEGPVNLSILPQAIRLVVPHE